MDIISYISLYSNDQYNCKNLPPLVGEGNGTALQHACLENPVDGGAWWAAVHGVAKSRTRLRDFTFFFTPFSVPNKIY